MKEFDEEIVIILEKELSAFKDNIIEKLQTNANFPNLDCEDLYSKGFDYRGEKRGTTFIDELRNFLNKKEVDSKVKFWIVNKWGGIGSFKENEKNNERIEKFEKELVKLKLTDDVFSVISSLSKIASFKNHKDHFVYDSRAIYTLNWLILKNNPTQPKFFPMPESRSSKLTLFDLNTLINLVYKDSIEDKEFKKDLFVSRNYAYFVYCDLIKELNKRLFPSHKPYYLEMLLFALADDYIFKNLKSSVKITIN